MIRHATAATFDVIECSCCGDGQVIHGTTEQRAADRQWFAGRHAETESGCKRGDERNAPRRTR